MSECIHGLTPESCTICLHGPSRPGPERKYSTCRTCGADVVWVVTEKGKPMPLDVDAGGGGRFRAEYENASHDTVVHFVKDSEMADNDQPLYTSHFATCPDRDLHRRR